MTSHDDSTAPPGEPPYDGFADMSDRLRHANWNAESLFAIGVVILVFAYMLAVIDGAAVARAHAALTESELEFRDNSEALIGELTEAERDVLKARQSLKAAENRRSTAGRDDVDLTDASLLATEKSLTVAEQARNRKLAEVQQASRLHKLDRQRDIERNILSQQIDSDANLYWYAWMQLPGFVCLFLGCIAFLKSESGVKRVTASIILAISLSVLVMLHLVPGTLRSQSLFNFRGGENVRFIEDE
ncbi:MAG: hypothetical protein WD875_14660 [Pirellulales bacterium]